jgi:hypothetical protein
MPSRQHEVQVELFRNRPVLALRLLELLGIFAPREHRTVDARVGSIDLSEAAPPEFRCDVLVELVGLRGLEHAVIVEVQLEADIRKRYTWPAYVAVARARLKCPVTLLVVALDRGVAGWVGAPIALGHPGCVLSPVVVNGDVLPMITDAARAEELPELAILSALAHRDAEVAEAAYAGLLELPDDQRKVYWDMILAALPDVARLALEAKMLQKYEYQSDFARKYYGEGLAEGEAKGLAEGEAKGEAKGLAMALHRQVVLKFGQPSAETEARIASATSEELGEYLERILTASSIDALFAR